MAGMVTMARSIRRSKKRNKTPPRAAAADPIGLRPEAMAELLSRVGGVSISAATILDFAARGAPTNGDGTIHLVHYAAWLAARVH